jgi:hypothetical protein
LSSEERKAMRGDFDDGRRARRSGSKHNRDLLTWVALMLAAILVSVITLASMRTHSVGPNLIPG